MVSESKRMRKAARVRGEGGAIQTAAPPRPPSSFLRTPFRVLVLVLSLSLSALSLSISFSLAGFSLRSELLRAVPPRDKDKEESERRKNLGERLPKERTRKNAPERVASL
jgi:hypothetical protein